MSAFTPSGSGGAPVSVSTDPTHVLIEPTGTVQSQFSTALSVLSGATSTILSYTVPVATQTYLLRIEVSGTNIATYDVTVDGQPWARTRTYFSGPFIGIIQVGSSPSDGYPLSTGQLVEISVTNFRPTTGDFEARLQYIEV